MGGGLFLMVDSRSLLFFVFRSIEKTIGRVCYGPHSGSAFLCFDSTWWSG